MITYILAQTDDQSDKEFIFEIYENFHRLMFATARARVKNAKVDDDIVEDIVQESLLRLIKHVNTLKTRDKPAQISYIVKTVRNTAINLMKKESRVSMHNESLDIEFYEIADSALPVFEVVSKKEMAAKLAEILDSLSWEERFLLEGKYFLGYNDKEIGEIIGCKAESVRMKRTRARRKVLAQFDENMEGLVE